MATMQARNCVSAVFDTLVRQNAKKFIGLVGHYGPIGTGRKGFDGFSAPIGGSTGLVGNNPVICTSQIVPQVFRENIGHFTGERDRDCPPERSVTNRRKYTHQRMVNPC